MSDITEQAWNIAMRRKVSSTEACAEEIEMLVRSSQYNLRSALAAMVAAYWGDGDGGPEPSIIVQAKAAIASAA